MSPNKIKLKEVSDKVKDKMSKYDDKNEEHSCLKMMIKALKWKICI